MSLQNNRYQEENTADAEYGSESVPFSVHEQTDSLKDGGVSHSKYGSNPETQCATVGKGSQNKCK